MRIFVVRTANISFVFMNVNARKQTASWRTYQIAFACKNIPPLYCDDGDDGDDDDDDDDDVVISVENKALFVRQRLHVKRSTRVSHACIVIADASATLRSNCASQFQHRYVIGTRLERALIGKSFKRISSALAIKMCIL